MRQLIGPLPQGLAGGHDRGRKRRVRSGVANHGWDDFLAKNGEKLAS